MFGVLKKVVGKVKSGTPAARSASDDEGNTCLEPNDEPLTDEPMADEPMADEPMAANDQIADIQSQDQKGGLFNGLSDKLGPAALMDGGVCALGGAAPVAVVLLRNYSPNVIHLVVGLVPGLNLITRFGAGQKAVEAIVELFKKILREQGELYLMDSIASVWLKNATSREALEKGIAKIPNGAVSQQVKEEALRLVHRYYIPVEDGR